LTEKGRCHHTYEFNQVDVDRWISERWRRRLDKVDSQVGLWGILREMDDGEGKATLSKAGQANSLQVYEKRSREEFYAKFGVEAVMKLSERGT